MLTLLALHLCCAAALPPLAGRVRLGRAVWAVAVAVPLLTLAWAARHAQAVLDGHPVTAGLAWADALGLRLDLRLDALALLMVCVVSGVGAAVLAYGAWYYTAHDAAREAALLLAFSGAMLGLVLADNVFTLYVFWELTTLASFLLIAGRDRDPARGRAARQSLLTTVAGGLPLLLGLVILAQESGTSTLSELVAHPPSGGRVTVALLLVLVGVFAKSAQFPLHAWLPAAMVAPTPVSAYLHAAAMVKAGVYLVARLAPGFADAPAWRPTVLAFGLLGLLLAAWRALHETDLKRLLAYATISELGLLIALFGAGTRTAALAGAVMLGAHALFKASLFMVTGVVERYAGTRDMRELSGLRARLPGACAVAALAAASMAGVPPLLGYLGKEATAEAGIEALGHGLGAATGGGWWPPALLAALLLGSALTVALAARYLWGAFGGAPPAAAGTAGDGGRPLPGPGSGSGSSSGVGLGPEHGGARAHAALPWLAALAPAAALAVTGVVAGVWHGAAAALAGPYADTLPGHGGARYELALWHGPGPAALAAATLLLGLAVHLGRVRAARSGGHPRRWPGPGVTPPRLPDAQHCYERTSRGVRTAASRLTRATQVGSLPVYLTVVLGVVVLLPGAALLTALAPASAVPLWSSAAQLPLAAVTLAAAAAVVATGHRLVAVVLVGAVGYGVAGLFFLHGAPDLALTQFLVESLTLVVMVLVLRRLPARFTPESPDRRPHALGRWLRATTAVAVGALVALFALATTHARERRPASDALLRRAAAEKAPGAANDGDGGATDEVINVVNAVIIDFRALDTLGEIAVLLVTGVGVLSLVTLWRGPEAEPGRAPTVVGPSGPPSAAPGPPAAAGGGRDRTPAARWDEPRERWLPGAAKRPAAERSVLLEVVTRLLFTSIIVLSLFVLFSGHYRPGGGFAAGLVAGQAFVLRYLVGGRADLGLAAPVDPAQVAGAGLAVAAALALAPLAFGAEPLTTATWHPHVPGVGTLDIGTSLLFDIGVYLLVAGVVLKLLAASGAADTPDPLDTPGTPDAPGAPREGAS